MYTLKCTEKATINCGPFATKHPVCELLGEGEGVRRVSPESIPQGVSPKPFSPPPSLGLKSKFPYYGALMVKPKHCSQLMEKMLLFDD